MYSPGGPVRIHLPHLNGKILIVVLGPLGCPLDGLSCSQKKYWWAGWFWAYFGKLWGKFGQKRQNSTTLEPLIVKTWLTPHFNRKTHLSYSVSYNVCSPDTQKWLKIKFFLFLEKSLHFENIVTRQALAILIWMITLVTKISYFFY